MRRGTCAGRCGEALGREPPRMRCAELRHAVLASTGASRHFSRRGACVQAPQDRIYAGQACVEHERAPSAAECAARGRRAEHRGRKRTCSPAFLKIVWWLPQLGSLMYTGTPGLYMEMNSAATRSAPVPDSVWTTAMRSSLTRGESAPKITCAVCLRNASSPWNRSLSRQIFDHIIIITNLHRKIFFVHSCIRDNFLLCCTNASQNQWLSCKRSSECCDLFS